MTNAPKLLTLALAALLSTGPAIAQSVTLKQRLAYPSASLEAFQSHEKALAAEKTALQERIDDGMAFQNTEDPDFGQDIFDVDLNPGLDDQLAQRQARLKTDGVQDPALLEAIGKSLKETSGQYAECVEDCEPFLETIRRLKEERTQLKALAEARQKTAAAEGELIALQRRALGLALSIAYRRAKRKADGIQRSQRRSKPERLTAALRRMFDAERQVHSDNLKTLDGLCQAIEDAHEARTTHDTQSQSNDNAGAQARTVLQDQQDKQRALVDDLLERQRQGDDVAEAIDDMHAGLLLDLDQSLGQIQPLQQAVDKAQQGLATAESTLRDGQTALKQLQTETPDAPNPCALEGPQRMQSVVTDAPTAHQSAALARQLAEVETRTAHVRLLESAVRLATTQQENNAEETRSIRTRIRQLLPYLSSGYDRSAFAYSPDFFRRLWDNLTAVAVTIQAHGLHRLAQLKRLPATLTTWGGIGSVLGALFWLAVLLIVGRRVIDASDTWLLAIWEWLSSRRWLQSALGLLHALFKLVSVVAHPMLVLGVALTVRWYLGKEEPEVAAGYTVVLWVIAYKIGVAVAKTLTVGPPWTDQRRRALAVAFDASPLLQHGPQVRPLSAQSLTWTVQYFILKLAVLGSVAQLFGQGYLYHLLSDVFAALLGLLLISLVWIWRSRVAQAYSAVAPPATLGFVQRNIHKHWLIVMVLPMAAIMVFMRILPWLRSLFGRSGTLAKLSVFFTRRRMEQIARDQEAERGNEAIELPADYTAHFELNPLTDEGYRVQNDASIQAVTDQFASWSTHRRDGSVAIVGEAGMGKTTLVNQLLAALPVPDEDVLRSDLKQKLTTEADVIAFVAQTFGFAQIPDSLEALEQAILDDPSPVVVIDNAHHFFLKSMGGMAGLEAFLHVVNMTCHNVFWITTFNAYSWYFLTNLKRSEPPFRQIVHLKPWSVEQIEALILQRSDQTPYNATFQDLIVDRGTEDRTFYEVVRTKHSYFRILNDMSGGNPSVALRNWLRSLRQSDDDAHTLRVGLYQPEPPQALVDASEDVLFALTAIATHERISVDALARVLRVPHDAIQRTINYCEEHALVQRNDDTVTLHLRNYRPIIHHLEMRSFIYF